MSGTNTVGVVVFSSALHGSTPDEAQRFEPNPRNQALGFNTRRITDRHPDFKLVAQQEVATWLVDHELVPDVTVEPTSDENCSNSQVVWRTAKDFFRHQDISRVIVIAQPWVRLQLSRHRRMVRRDGFTVVREQIRNMRL